MMMNINNGKRGFSAMLAFALAMALALTAVPTGAVFADDSIAERSESATLSGDASGFNWRVMDEATGQSVGSPGANDAAALTSSKVRPPETHLLKNGKPVDADDNTKSAAYGDSKALASWEPAASLPTGEVGNAFQAGGDKAGREITFTVAGLNQESFFKTVPKKSGEPVTDAAIQDLFKSLNLTPDVTYALIPAGLSSQYASSWSPETMWPDGQYDDRWDVYDPPFQYTHSYERADTFTDRIIFQKWTVRETPPTTTGAIDSVRYWELDTANKWYQDFSFKLQGYVTYEGDGNKTTTKWVDNGAAYPDVKPTRKGFKFGGWYTKFPTGGDKIVPGKTQVWFGEGYSKTVYVHWDKKVKIKFDPNKGKITKGKKTVNVAYRGKLGKAPTAKRSSYTSLGWYFAQKSGGKTYYTLHDKKLTVLVPKATFKTQWIKNGKKKTVSQAEWDRLLSVYKKGLFINYKSVKAAIGGKGASKGKTDYYIGSDGSYSYYIRCKVYEWKGNQSGTVVRMYFSAKTGNLIDGVKVGALS
jgi:hypothetical protein